MTLLELLMIAVGLSMDAFAVSICKGLGLRRPKLRHMVTVGLYFGVAQAVMPMLGYLLGSGFSDMVSSLAPWIAFVLLAFIGAKMLWEALRGGEETADCGDEIIALSHKELFTLSIATSIDALAVGVTFAFLDVAVIPSSTLIGCTTFLICVVGVKLGGVVGDRFEKKASILGGVMLICVGLKILLEHLLA